MFLQKAPCSLAIPALFWILGLICGFYLEPDILLFIIITAAFLIALRLSGYNYFLLLMLVLLAGIIRMQTAEYRDSSHIRNILDTHSAIRAEITGKIKRTVSHSSNSILYKVKLDSLSGHKTQGTVYLKAKQEYPEGSIITGKVDMEKLQGCRNPGQRDNSFSYHSRGIDGWAKSSDSLQIVPGSKLNIFNQLRTIINTTLEERLPHSAGFASSIITGSRSSFPRELTSRIRKAGLSHLFAVSGLHVGIIFLIFYSLLMTLYPHRVMRIIILSILLLYAFLCQWTPSVSRAVLMIGIYTICRLAEKPVNINQVLLLSLVIITITAPQQIFSAGLQLSFAATLVIINISPRLETLFFWRKRPLFITTLLRLLQTILITLSVIVFIAPVALAHFGEFSANALISIIPASLAFTLMLPLAICTLIPFFWQPFANCFELLTRFFRYWIELSSELPFFWCDIRVFVWQATAIYLILFMANWLYSRYHKIPALMVFLCLPLMFIIPKIHIEKTGDLRITCLDCGQGDMSFIEFPDGENMLIDTGPPPSGYGTIDNSLIPWLKLRNIKSIDYVLITHAHNDHYGGLQKILEVMEVKTLIAGKDLLNDLPDKELVQTIGETSANLQTVEDSLLLYAGNVRIFTLLPQGDFTSDNQNNKSLVTIINYHDLQALFTGDIETEAENWLLLHHQQKIDCDFMKVPHHGSITSSTIKFINAVSPDICFIPAGRNNRFHLPYQEVIDRYQYLGDKLINGAEEGALLMASDGKNLECDVMFRDTLIYIPLAEFAE